MAAHAFRLGRAGRAEDRSAELDRGLAGRLIFDKLYQYRRGRFLGMSGRWL